MSRRKTQLIKNNERMKKAIKDYECEAIMQNDYIVSLQKRSSSKSIRVYRLEDDIAKLTRENKSLKSDISVSKAFYDISLREKKDKDTKIMELKTEINNKTKMAQGNINLNIINKAKCEKYREKNQMLAKKVKNNSDKYIDMAIINVRLERENKELRARSNWDKLKEIVGLR